ncbi:AEC family transporter [Alkalilimnicola ehrlichii MLHE-1]|uniref:Auxin Efflux Carrier n=1 Tax=Alkalilimnicola ehrlichii (strain ATCC BAA-1101 / DSM 17681 / MLHE-1) TaxID=187272 RepID=Q0AAZ7_ALKEH|nr:AEC family transporter [Alkalilimnicola ehrlichii]ABI55990.1 Auxin Efflux Carrier [Alkalilimnicola ehrlichii MLHE-1]
MEVVLAVALPFFALIFTGMAAGRTRLLEGTSTRPLNTFVFYFALPALLLSGTAEMAAADILRPALFLSWLLPALLLFFTTWLGLRWLFGRSAGEGAIQALVATFGNVGFVGLPLVVTAMGTHVLPAAMVVIIVDSAIMIAVATAIIEWERDEGSGFRRALRTAGLGVARNPLVIASAVGVTLALLSLSLPAPLLRYLELLGAAAGPTALFALGITLARQPVRSAGPEVAILVAAKLLIHAPVVWLATWLLGLDGPLQTALVILATLPVAANVHVLAQRYGLYAGPTSTAILISTVLSMVTVSLALSLLL